MKPIRLYGDDHYATGVDTETPLVNGEPPLLVTTPSRFLRGARFFLLDRSTSENPYAVYQEISAFPIEVP